jgi:hypothetical protein
MLKLYAEKRQSQLLGVGTFFTTIAVVSGSATDPVNTPKFLVLGILASAAMAITISSKLILRLKETIPPVMVILFFLVASISATANSRSPLSQNMYGTYGRNNGLLTYLFLSVLFLTVLTFRQQESFDRVLKALFLAGIVNVAYCLWVLLFGDFVGWSNPYGNILGTFGNPNFIGSFLGIFLGAYAATFFSKTASKNTKLFGILIVPVTLFEIVKSHAIQGRVVAVFAVSVVLFYYLRSKFNFFVVGIYSVGIFAAGTLSLMGALQIGPLAPIIYKTSVSLRGQYWLAGWNTGQSNPLAGVGMDSFGDWYRRARSPRAIELPGVDTVVNASHNVPLDMFAFGGWPLFLAYLSIIALTIGSILRFTIRSKTYDPTFVSLTVAWLGYQLQSLISINQIGLAVWGWILSAAIISYDRLHVPTVTGTEKFAASASKKVPKSGQVLNQQLQLPAIGVLGAAIGLMIALPPFSGDVKWRAAQVSQSVAPLEASLRPEYFNPQTSMKYLNTIQIFEQNQLYIQSHKLALNAVRWNPEAFELWKILFLIQNSTEAERALALQNMKRLDPLNPDVTSTQ